MGCTQYASVSSDSRCDLHGGVRALDAKRWGRGVDDARRVAVPELECPKCGHLESWQRGNYMGERTDFDHHVCGQPGTYGMCGEQCEHDFPGCALLPAHPAFRVKPASE